MDEFEIQEATRKLMEDLSILPRMLEIIEDKKGILSDSEDSVLLSNLCELQDSVIALGSDNGYYDDICSSLHEFAEQGKQILKKFKKFPLRPVLERTIQRIDLYLRKIPKYQDHYGGRYTPKTEPTLKHRINEELGRKADQLLRDVSSEIQVEELSKNLRKLSKNKVSLVELSKEKEQEINEKLDLAVDTLILSQLRKGGK